MTRGEVAERLGVSISTVRRYEGTQLHPTVDEHGVRWFTQVEVTTFAAKLANERGDKASHMAGVTSGAPKRSAGELAALAFERFEQRQSLAEIVIGLRIEPSVVRALFDEWCLGLTAGHLQSASDPLVSRETELTHVKPTQLEKLLGELSDEQVTRISVARFRGIDAREDIEFADVIELGGFHAAGPLTVADLVARFGRGDFRVTAFGFAPPCLRWEVLVMSLA